jgi:hypothetical protein
MGLWIGNFLLTKCSEAPLVGGGFRGFTTKMAAHRTGNNEQVTVLFFRKDNLSSRKDNRLRIGDN